MSLPLVDNITSLPYQLFHFTPTAYEKLKLMGENLDPHTFYHTLVSDIESETQQILALQLTETLLTAPLRTKQSQLTDRKELEAYITQTKNILQKSANKLNESNKEERQTILKQRALLSMLAGCWLDRVSQPATEPAGIINLLNAHNFIIKGIDGIGLAQQRQQYFNTLDILIPYIGTSGVLTHLQSNELTIWQALFMLSISRLPSSYLPELIGIHFAYYSLAFDDLLLEQTPQLSSEQLSAFLEGWINACNISATGQEDLRRFYHAVCLFTELELDHSAMLLEQKSQLLSRTIDDKMAEIIRCHFPFAGKQHQHIILEKKPLNKWQIGDTAEMEKFLNAFRHSIYLNQESASQKGECRFMQAIHFGGSMFGIFNKQEAKIMADWIIEIQRQEYNIKLNNLKKLGEDQSSFWRERYKDTNIETLINLDNSLVIEDRELFYRLVNIEHYSNCLQETQKKIIQTLQNSEILFSYGQQGRYTDASYFDYSYESLKTRTEEIYWNKLVNPIKRLTEIPDRESVIFNQKLMALGSLIDGAWAHRFGNTLRNHRRSDRMMLAIYADEMGRGETEKNHITIILNVLNSMGITLPHIRTPEFRLQQELPDLYAFALHQLSMSLFPDTFYEELLGYNLGIEMLGLGEMRKHEIQKMRYYGFDTTYEEAHLTIDNFSAGHARQSINLIVAYMEDLEPTLSADERQQRWRRIWRGYASFAWFLETDLKNEVSTINTYNTLLI